MDVFETRLHEIQNEGLLRKLYNVSQQGAWIELEGKRYLNFSSNDYLGLTTRLDWQQEFLKNLATSDIFSMSSTASRLQTGNHAAYTRLENTIRQAYGRDACLLFNSGYNANLSILPALTTKRDLIVADKLVHASLIDGMRLCEARWVRFAHNNYDHLYSILQKERHLYDNVFIVTESIYSMDGDVVDLQRLVQIKNEFNAILYLDEAHAVGVIGNNGLGLCDAQNLVPQTDIIVGTFGKSFISEGAFVVCNNAIRDMLVNKSRAVLYTTAMPPINVLWTEFVFARTLSLQSVRNYLLEITQLFRSELKNAGIDTLGETHIVPLVVGNNHACIAVAEQLKREGIWSMPIRYPTVPLNSARIRFSMVASMTKQEIQQSAAIIAKTMQDKK